MIYRVRIWRIRVVRESISAIYHIIVVSERDRERDKKRKNPYLSELAIIINKMGETEKNGLEVIILGFA